MKVLTKTFELTPGESLFLEPICCIHKGNVGHDKVKFDATLKRILDKPNRYTILMGDLAEAIDENDRRYDPRSVDWVSVYEQAHKDEAAGIEPERSVLTTPYRVLQDDLRPLAEAGKILAVGTGNHDYKIHKANKFDPIQTYITGPLNLPYMLWMWWLDLRFTHDGKQIARWIVNGSHGAYSGRRIGGNLNRLEDLAMGYEADVFLRGHTHQLGFSERLRYVLGDDGLLRKKKQYFGAVGSFLQGHVQNKITYAEMFDLLPLDTGTLTVEFNPWEEKIDIHK